MKKYKAVNLFIHRKIAGRDILIPIDDNAAKFNGYVELNPSAAFLWDILREPKTTEQLASELESNFNITYNQALDDACDFIDLLIENKMVIEL